MSRRRAPLLATLALGIAACAVSTGSITTRPDGFRTFSPFRSTNGAPILCTLGAADPPVSGRLAGRAGARPEPAWLVDADGRHLSIVWPEGFSVRFEREAELIDDHGIVVAREGDEIVLGQVPVSEHEGTFADPYFASGIVFDGCYPFSP